MTRARQWSVLTAVACLAVLAAGWFVVVKPQRSHAASLRSQAADVLQSNQTLQAQIAHLRAQAKDLPNQQRKLAEIATKVPDSPALPTLIRQLSAAADSSGVNLVSLSPGQPTLVQTAVVPVKPVAPTGTGTAATGTAPTAPVTTSATSAPAAMLASIPLQIQVQGSYFNLEQFFAALELLPRAMKVTQFTAGPLSAGGAGGGVTVAPGTLNVTMTASVFMSPNGLAGTSTGK